ncbi:MAG TPA: 2-dehydropantoate 2-reductase [Opitutaceae bacterium]|nr:2-dehydropantoate 2-reductase [Opitutaceae bacterium]
MNASPQFGKIAIVGSGAIGLYYGTKLALAGGDVRFLMRSDLAAVRARGSIRLCVGRSTTELHPAAVFGAADEIGSVDLVIVTLKTTANGEFPRLLPPLLGPQTAILTLQNGLGSDEQLGALFGAERVMGGLAFIATNRTGPGEVVCYHPGSVALGELGRPATERTRALAAQFEAAGVKTGVTENLNEARWRKLIWNIPFNGLAVAHRCATDTLCAGPALAAEVKALMREVQAAAARLGFIIHDEFLREQFDVTPSLGAYQPSSLVDHLAGREVEVEAIWGEPLRRARAAGAATPRLEKLYGELKRLTAQRGA